MVPRYTIIGLLGLLMVVSACDSVSSSTATLDSQTPTQVQTASSPKPSPTQTDNLLPAPATVLDLLPDAPASIDGDFRADSYLVVGATGRPQVVEVFSYN
jgi:hypothetical protein